MPQVQIHDHIIYPKLTFLFTRLIFSARDVLDYYASKRTFDSKGVTPPSQRRFVAYFAAKLEMGLKYLLGCCSLLSY